MKYAQAVHSKHMLGLVKPREPQCEFVSEVHRSWQ